LEEVKKGVADGTIHGDDVADYYTLVGQTWASIQAK
jgi:hypothetical protein